MIEETQAASSPAEVEDVFRGENVSHAEFSHYRQTGELPERFKPTAQAEAESADEPEETASEDLTEEVEAESAGDPEPPKDSQEKKRGAEQRIKQLLEQKKQLERDLEEARRPKQTQADPSPAPVIQGEPSPEDKNADGTPKFKTYEEYTKALARWEIRQELAEQQRIQAAQAQQRELTTKVDEARARYGDELDKVMVPTANRIMGDNSVTPAVKAMLNDSEVLPDVLFTIGSDPKTLSDFLQLPPGKQLRYIAAVESEIHAELSGESAQTRDENGKFTAKEPPAKQQTRAPKPPSPVGGGSSKAFDVSDESLSAEEWSRQRNADLNRRGRG